MLVEDLMTAKVLSVAPQATLSEAIGLMLSHNISGLPVVDDHGALVGMISEGDLLRRVELGTQEKPSSWSRLFLAGRIAQTYALTHGRRVEEIMSRACVTVERKTKLVDAVALMQYHFIRRLPVIEDERVVGIISRSDIVRVLATKLERSDADADLADGEIATRILAQFYEQDWLPPSSIDVSVDHGHVTLSGAIADTRQRQAARILAENVIGVKSVTDVITWGDPAAMIAF